MSRRGLLLCAVGCAVLWCLAPTGTASTIAPPNNDNYLYSYNLNLPGEPLSTDTFEAPGDTIGATDQANLLSPCRTSVCLAGPAETLSCHGVSYGKTVWYDFYPDHNGQVEIRTFGFPNVIALYKYSPTTLVPHEIQCASGSKARSNELFQTVQRGVDYTFQIGGRGGIGNSFRMLFNYAYSSDLAVAPFLTRAFLDEFSGPPRRVTLVKLLFIGLTRNEQVSYGCAACGASAVGSNTTSGNTLTTVPYSAPSVTAATRLIVSATAPAEIGRFKVYAVNPNLTLRVTAQGCLAPNAPAVTASAALNPASLDQTACPTAPVNLAGAEYVFWGGRGGRLEEDWYSGASWIGPLVIPHARLADAPAVAVHPNGEQDVFWKGSNDGLWEMWYTGKWNGPVDIGGGQLGSNPTVGIDSANDEYVFWRGAADGALWETTYADGLWSQPIPLNSGQLGSAPAVAVHPDGEQDVFWRGTNGNLYEMTFTGQWNSPIDRGGGQLGSAPSVGIDSFGNEYVFWEGTDGALWEMTNTARGWSQPIPLRSGPLGSRPEVAVHPDRELDVFWRGANGGVREMWYTDQWNGPTRVPSGGIDTSPGVAVASVGKLGTGP